MKSIKTLVSTMLFAGTLLSSSAVLADTPATTATPQVATQTETVTVAQATASVGDKLNINSASAADIQKALIGIGAKKAEAIVQYREKHGAFTSVEQLLEVQGIGQATLDKNKDRIIF
ncbi:ComEA family DNA-binding protein [Lonepinella sp. BR2271]|uniref:ComEA family DNA-binding protein n=1 Tax=Lonepinella sp. BR2271 TaxID=3434550 RepID=UPI003F6DEB6B